jgi:ribonuclease P protein component
VGAVRPDRPRLTFPAQLRVRRKADFESAYRAGRRFGDNLLSMTVTPNSLGVPRLGLAIAARTVGNSVARNRLRRLIRESFRLAQLGLPQVDIIVGARAGARTATAPRVRESLAALWTKVAKQCAPSPAA